MPEKKELGNLACAIQGLGQVSEEGEGLLSDLDHLHLPFTAVQSWGGGFTGSLGCFALARQLPGLGKGAAVLAKSNRSQEPHLLSCQITSWQIGKRLKSLVTHGARETVGKRSLS